MTPTHAPVAVILLGSDPCLSRGGIAAVLPSYVALLAAAGIPNRLITTHSNDRLSGKFRHIPGGVREMLAAIREYRSQHLTPVVHAHTGKWPSLIRKRAFLLIAKAAGARTILHLHGSDIQAYLDEPMQRRVLTAFLRGIDMVLTLGPHWAGLVTSRTGVRARILPNPLSPDLEAQARLPIPEKPRSESTRLLSLGRLIPGRGFDFLLEVVARLPSSFELTLAGDGELLPFLRKQAQRLECDHRVRFPGWVSGAAKEHLFASADVFCLFTQRDSLSTAMVEAMAHGLPVVACDYGPTRDLVPDDAGLFIEAGLSAEKTAEALSRLLPTERLSMGVAAKRSLLDRYNPDRVTKDWISLLDELGKQHESSSRVD